MKRVLLIAGTGLFLLLPADGARAAGQGYREFYRGLPSTQTKNWDKKLLRRKPASRIRPLAGPALDFNRAFNKRDGFKEQPAPATAPAGVRQELVRLIRELPRPVRRFFNRHVIGIYTATGVGSSAMTGTVYDKKGKARFGFVIIDLDKMSRRANEWATYKENTVFGPVKDYRLRVVLEEGAGNTRAAALRYLLIHEIGHLFHAVMELQPAYINLTWKTSQLEKFAFNVPEIRRQRMLGEDYYPLYEKISFYRAEPPFDLDDAPEVYEWIRETTFPTLYGAVNLLEDFAETFATLIHCRYLKRPYRVILTTGGKDTLLISDPTSRPARAGKIAIIEKALRRLDPAFRGAVSH